MPTTSTGNKRASSASSKKSGLKRRFDLTNRKVQFFVVIAIVAVLGGGWFTYRSFAASSTWYYSLNAGNLKFHGATLSSTPTCNTSRMTDKEKNVTNVIGVICQDSAPVMAGFNFDNAGLVVHGGGSPSNPFFGSWAQGRNTRTCVDARVTTDNTNVYVEQSAGWKGSLHATPWRVRTVIPVSKGGYTKVCTPWQKINVSVAPWSSGGIVSRAGGITAGYVSQVTIEMQ